MLYIHSLNQPFDPYGRIYAFVNFFHLPRAWDYFISVRDDTRAFLSNDNKQNKEKMKICLFSIYFCIFAEIIIAINMSLHSVVAIVATL